MALAAAYFETGGDAEERRALEWLETLPPPMLRAPEAMPRRPVTHYVPVNDKPSGRTGVIQSIPQLTRDRQERTFARAWIDGDVYLVWTDIEAEAPLERAIDTLARKVTRVGHSMSLVQMWVASPEEVGDVNWIPDETRAEVFLRVPGPETLGDLERRYNLDAAEAYASLRIIAEDGSDNTAQREARRRLREQFGNEPPLRLRPTIARFQGYARQGACAAASNPPSGVFSPHLVVFALEARSGPFVALGLQATLQVVHRWHDALVSSVNDAPASVRELVSGRDHNGAPLDRPHLALVPLAFVGRPHADGHLIGVAAALPNGLSPEERRQVLRVLGRVRELKLGRLGVWALVRDTSARPPWNLRPEAWTAHPGGATQWATVTPVAFDRHPKAKGRGDYRREAAEIIAESCVATGLPRPREVIVTSVSAHLGAPPAYIFPRLRRKDGSERSHLHAILVFDEAVRGPVLVGAGRFRGYGLCRPMEPRAV
jgi:CRISPR-associated protein Csb2